MCFWFVVVTCIDIMESVVMLGSRRHCICRLCLSTGRRLVDILSDAEFLVKRAVEELLQITVAKDELCLWMVCSICVEKVRDFYLFKRCCVENQEVYDSHIRKIIFPGSEVVSAECGNINVKVEDDSSNWDRLVHDSHGTTENNLSEIPKATMVHRDDFDGSEETSPFHRGPRSLHLLRHTCSPTKLTEGVGLPQELLFDRPLCGQLMETKKGIMNHLKVKHSQQLALPGSGRTWNVPKTENSSDMDPELAKWGLKECSVALVDIFPVGVGASDVELRALVSRMNGELECSRDPCDDRKCSKVSVMIGRGDSQGAECLVCGKDGEDASMDIGGDEPSKFCKKCSESTCKNTGVCADNQDAELPTEEINGEGEDDGDVSMDPLMLEGSSSEEEGAVAHRDSTWSWPQLVVACRGLRTCRCISTLGQGQLTKASVNLKHCNEEDNVQENDPFVSESDLGREPEIPAKAEEGEGVENSMDVNSGHLPKAEVPGIDSEAPPGGMGITGANSQLCEAGSGMLSMQATPTQGQNRAATECLNASIPASDVSGLVSIVPLPVSASVASEEGQKKSHFSDSGSRGEDEIISFVVLGEGESREAVASYDSTLWSTRVMEQKKRSDVESIECTEGARNVSRIGVQSTGCGARNQLPLSDENPHGRSFKCDKCGSRFRSKYLIGQHMKVHNVVSVFKCSTCDFDFDHEGEYKGHKCAQGKINSRTLHNADKRVAGSASNRPSNSGIQNVNPIKKLLSCGVCSKSFHKPSTLAIHIRTHTGERPFSCTVCGRSFAQKGNLKQHMMSHYGTKPYSCSNCSKSFKQKHSLQSHMAVHTGLKAYSCSNCSKSFSHKRDLRRHMSVHNGLKAFSCSHCSKSFSRKDSLRNHMAVHTGLKAYSCSNCSKSSSQKRDLHRHMSVHNGLKAFSRSHCSKSFSRKDSLRNHMAVHTALKAYSCSNCSKSFSQKRDLHRHMSVHNGLKAFSCSHCSKSFSRKDSLRNHMVVHTGLKAFSCGHCSKSYSRKDSLRNHMEVHTGVKSYSCSLCSKSFPSNNNLNQHMKMHN